VASLLKSCMDGTTQLLASPSEYVHAVANACQRFVGSIAILEPGAFIAGVTELLADVPSATSEMEALMIWEKLRHATERGASDHHALFHRFFGGSPCLFQAGSLPSAVGFERETTQHAVRYWAESYMVRLEGDHAWPVAVKAAVTLRACFGKRWQIDEIGRAVGASAATLERGFSKVYGVTVGQYLALARVRAALLAIRAGDTCIQSIALQIGYRTSKDLYRVLRMFGGGTPTTIRRLNEAQFAILLERDFALPIPGLPFRRGVLSLP
jgi:AraC-like DNA-binding protein